MKLLDGIKLILSNLFFAIKIIFRADGRMATIIVVVRLLNSYIPICQAWIAKLIIDIISANNTNDHDKLLGFILLEFMLFFVSIVCDEVNSFSSHILGNKVVFSINSDILKKVTGLSMVNFDNPDFYNRIKNAQANANYRGIQLVDLTFGLLQSLIIMLSIIVILLNLSHVVVLIILFANLPAFIARIYNSGEYYKSQIGNTPNSRKMSYIEQLLIGEKAIKEIKTLKLGEYFLKQHKIIYEKFRLSDDMISKKRLFSGILWGGFACISFYIVYYHIVLEATTSSITIGDMVFYLALFKQAQTVIQDIFFSAAQAFESSLFLNDLQFMMNTKDLEAFNGTRKFPSPITQGITLENVSFRYPNHEQYTLKNINIHVKPGESVAIVGLNGSGKTTLVKLLAGLYKPTEGRILLDGLNMDEYAKEDLHERISVIFQDFVQYYATFRENIGYGSVEHINNHERVKKASLLGGADPIVHNFPKKYETVIGYLFENGTQLSGGQWQKIAISRALMRDGDVFILDEPTSALDAEHEYHLFQTIKEITKGKITFLVSHRFSTTRMAQRIVVLGDGKIIEVGSHVELMELKGVYSQLFLRQAENYK